MAKQHTIACGITPVSRVYVRRNDAKYRQNATVFIGGIQIGEVAKYGDGWRAFNTVNSRVKPTNAQNGRRSCEGPCVHAGSSRAAPLVQPVGLP